MPYIGPRGNPLSRIWVIIDKPFGSDKGTLFSGGMGHVFEKMLSEAGIDSREVYFTSRAPNTDAPSAYSNLEADLNHYAPPLILALSAVAGWFLPELREPGRQASWRQ